MAKNLFLLFDIGGTNMRIASSRDLKSLETTHAVKTPRIFEEGIALFKKIGREIARGEKIQAVCGGIAGPLNKTKSRILNAPNLSGWNKKPLKEKLTEAFDCPAFIENDATVAGLGEAHFGAGAGRRIVAYLTISTGVGGARIVNGRIDENALGFEPGHQIIDKNGTTLESLISGSGLSKRYGKTVSAIKNEAIWNETACLLAIGIANTIVYWSPDIVILGGSLMKTISLPNVRTHLKKTLTIFQSLPSVVRSKLGDSAGLYGAMVYMREKM